MSALGQVATWARELPASSDPKEQELRELWHRAKGERDGGVEGGAEAFQQADRKLSAYLWERVERDIAVDRAKHPRAKRNLPVGPKRGGGRALP